MHKIVFYRNDDMFATKGQIGGSLRRLETRNGHFRGIFSGLFSSPANLQVKHNTP